MCGIAGIILNKEGNSNINISNILDKMAIHIKNRGPDNTNKWISSDNFFGTVHTRLSIIGLGESGNQPMISHNGRYVMSFNGEIYNFLILKEELNNLFDVKWVGKSDSEVLLEGISLLGLDELISKIEGMYAIALWDKKLKNLTLVRDRIGEKPLYFGRIKNDYFESICFSSDIGSFTNLNKSKLDMDDFSIYEFINNGWINGSKTIYKNIHKVLPGEYIVISQNQNDENFIIKRKKYWEINYSLYEKSATSDFEKEINELNIFLIKILKQQIFSDRKMGIFLSGGLDSSLIASIIRKELNVPIQCITCGFENELNSRNYDETLFAKKITNALDMPHLVKKITSSDVIETLPKMSAIFSEPFADISQIGTYLISKKARESEIIVALGGDGGDELFGGYERYLSGNKLLLLKRYFPKFFFKYLNNAANLLPDFFEQKLAQIIGVDNLREKIEKFYNNLDNFQDKESLYLACLSKWDQNNFNQLGLNISFASKYNNQIYGKDINKLDLRTYMMMRDLETYLVDDVLVKTDRASMSVGLEIRSPFLNHNLVNYANSISSSSKFSFKQGKLHLRAILERYLNKELINRPKKGFSIPIDEMIRSSVKDWSNDMLMNLKSNNELSINSKLLDKMWNEHLSGERNHGNCLWNLIMFSSWMDIWRR